MEVDEAAAKIAAVDQAAAGGAHDVRWHVQRGVSELAGAAGAEETRRPCWPGSELTVPVAEPVAGLRAAVRVRWAAESEVNDHVREARRQGVTWAVIGQALGLEPEEGTSLGEAAYDAIAAESGPWRERSFHFTCGTCLQGISDRGPFSGHPDDNESGHAGDCGRHRAEVSAYEKDRWLAAGMRRGRPGNDRAASCVCRLRARTEDEGGYGGAGGVGVGPVACPCDAVAAGSGHGQPAACRGDRRPEPGPCRHGGAQLVPVEDAADDGGAAAGGY